MHAPGRQRAMWNSNRSSEQLRLIKELHAAGDIDAIAKAWQTGRITEPQARMIVDAIGLGHPIQCNTRPVRPTEQAEAAALPASLNFPIDAIVAREWSLDNAPRLTLR